MHTTQLGYGGVPITWINKMQGRRGDGTQGTYTKPNPIELIEMFKRGYPTLSGIEVDTSEVETLRAELLLNKKEHEDDILTMRKRLDDQAKMIEQMAPAVELARRFIEKERGLDRTVEAE
jgi:hypothetical protein